MAYSDIIQLASYTLHATESIVYTAPVSKSVEVATFWIHNRAGSTITTTAWFPFTAATPTATATGSLERFSESIVGYGTLEISPKVPFILNSSGSAFSDKITMKATQSSSINVIIYGRQMQ